MNMAIYELRGRGHGCTPSDCTGTAEAKAIQKSKLGQTDRRSE